MPGSKQAWPNSAACWSPATPEIGMPAGTPTPTAVVPKRPDDGRTSGRHAAGTPSRSQSSSDHDSVRMSNSIVREAFDGSVACTWPPVSCHSSQVSIGADGEVLVAGHAAAALLGRAEQPLELGAREVRVEHEAGGAGGPGRGARPPASSSQRAAVRRSCQTMAR